MIDSRNGSRTQLIALTISLIAPLIIVYFLACNEVVTSLSDQFLLTIGLFIAFELINLLYLTSQISKKQIELYNLWSVQSEGDQQLTNIRACFANLLQTSYGKKDVFVAHFMRMFKELESDIREVSEKKSLRTQANHFLSVDNILNAFVADEDRIWRYTWRVEEDEVLFPDPTWKLYFEKTAIMAREKNLKGIRTIFIADDLHFSNIPRYKKVLDFFKTNPGLDCRLMSKSGYDVICKDNGIPILNPDFGIYGITLLFLTEQYEPEIIGVFSKDESQVKKYQQLFDTMWNSDAITHKNPSSATTQVTLQELFEFDELQVISASEGNDG